jgi:hypothetical protein
MPPLWNPEEADSKVYKNVEKPTAGVITVRYRPPSQSDVESLKNTEIYGRMRRRNGGASLDEVLRNNG